MLLVLCTLVLGVTTAQSQGSKSKVTMGVKHANGTSTVSIVDDSDSVGIVAFSDTASVDTVVTVRHSSTIDHNYNFDLDDLDSLPRIWDVIGSAFGSGGIIALVCGILLILFILLLPILIIALIIWLIVRSTRDNRRYDNYYNQTNQYQEAPQEPLHGPAKNNKNLWNSGVRNICLGLGLFVCGYFVIFGSLLKGIGVILVFVGIGQLIISRNSGRNG